MVKSVWCSLTSNRALSSRLLLASDTAMFPMLEAGQS